MALNVLIVDDSAVMRRMVAKVLHMTGIELGEVHEAADGREGLDILDRHWVDLALVDINMPVMNGEEMIHRVRARPEIGDLAIVVVSSDGSSTRSKRLQEQGVRFIRKPFTPETFRRVVGEVTGVGHEQSV